jgi:hypothetical protein
VPLSFVKLFCKAGCVLVFVPLSILIYLKIHPKGFLHFACLHCVERKFLLTSNLGSVLNF